MRYPERRKGNKPIIYGGEFMPGIPMWMVVVLAFCSPFIFTGFAVVVRYIVLGPL